MNHDQAIREQAVERYLLGELAEDARARFEDHFFDCTICASELKTEALFVDTLQLIDSSPTPPSPISASSQSALHRGCALGWCLLWPLRCWSLPIKTFWCSLPCDGLLRSLRPQP